MAFSSKSCKFWRNGWFFSKKWVISWKSTKNHRFGQNKQLFEQTTMLGRFGERKTEQKNFVIIDLAKTCNSSRKLSCFGVLVNFSAKSWKKWLISWKRTKHHRFGQKLQLFQQTTMFPRFGQLFTKKVEKVAHFVKNDEESSIWPKLATFRGNYHVSAFLSTFQQKVAKSGSFCEGARKLIHLAKTSNFSSKLPCFGLLVNFWAKSESFRENHEKSSIWPKLTTSRTNYHVSAFWSAFQQKVVKSIVGTYQAQAIITGFATSICSFHLCRDWGNDFWNYVSRSTGVLG